MAFARKPGTPKTFLNEDGLFEYAVRALGRQMRSEADLRQRLRPRALPDAPGDAAVETVIARLKEYGYLDDASFAETYARLRQENQKLGARRVSHDLRRKGVQTQLVNETVAAQYDGADEEALARAHLERKGIGQPKTQKETARVMRRLAAAGFSTGAIVRILRSWNVAEDELAQIESSDSAASTEFEGTSL